MRKSYKHFDGKKKKRNEKDKSRKCKTQGDIALLFTDFLR